MLLKDMNARAFHNGHMVVQNEGCSVTFQRDGEDLDLYVVGFPCTPFSAAGLRQGFADPASKCFFSASKIILAMRPRVGILENVVGFSHNANNAVAQRAFQAHRGFVWERLAGGSRQCAFRPARPTLEHARPRQALSRAGFQVVEAHVNSVDFGIPQTRSRVYLVLFRQDGAEINLHPAPRRLHASMVLLFSYLYPCRMHFEMQPRGCPWSR